VLRKVVAHYKNKHKNVKTENFVIIFINKTLDLQGIKTFSKIHIYSKMINKKTCHVLGQLYAFIIISCKKIVPKFIHMNFFLGGKWHAIFLNSNHIGSLYLVCTHIHFAMI
jgi:hypothetical protein